MKSETTYSSSSHLILGGLGSEPKVDVPSQRSGAWMAVVGVEDNVGVSSVELAVVLLRPRLDDELLDAPDLQPRGLAGVGPLRFMSSSSLSAGLVHRAAHMGDVASFEGGRVGLNPVVA